jgi:hypothetical protein
MHDTTYDTSIGASLNYIDLMHVVGSKGGCYPQFLFVFLALTIPAKNKCLASVGRSQIKLLSDMENKAAPSQYTCTAVPTNTTHCASTSVP